MYEPLWAVLEVTNQCDLRCRHCSSCRDTAPVQEELTLPEWRRIIFDIAAHGCHHVTLSGGEPLIRKDIYELIQYCKDCGLETTITSNGMNIDEFVAKRLAEYEVDGVQISIDGLQQDHEFLRGKGSFIRAMRAIQLLLAEGINSSTMTVLSSLNKYSLSTLVEYLSEESVHSMGFERLTPVGRAQRLKNFTLSSSQIKEVFQQLYHLSKSYPIKINDPLKVLVDPHLQEYSKDKNFICGGCLTGVATCTISACGELKLCTRIPYAIGCLTKVDFQALWLNDLIIQRLRTREFIGKCKKCQFHFICGGCRAEALAVNDNLLGDDPGCWLL